MRMPFSHEPSRMERARCAVRDRTSGAAHTLSGAATTAAGAAGGAATTAAGAAQDAAHVVADRATVAAQQIADRAGMAATTIGERARPLASEAALRCAAAWQILRYGVPRPSPMARVVSVLPMAAGTAARRSKGPAVLMVLGAAGAVGVLLWRRSRTGGDTVWILDDDNDIEPVGRWHEGDSRGRGADKPADDRDVDRDVSRPGGDKGDRKDSAANRWP